MYLSQLVLALTLVFTCTPAVLAKNSLNSDVKQGSFHYGKAPTKAEWQFFLRSSSEFKNRLWLNSQSGKNKGLKAWSWQWRLGWLRACKKFAKKMPSDNPRWCKQIEALAVKDNAMVVRNEAVRVLQAKKQHYSEKELLKLISIAYKHPGNIRRGKPLYIINRILFALHEIGTPKAKKLMKNLAKSHESSRRYAKKLVRSTKF